MSSWKLRRAKEINDVRRLELERAEAVLRRKTVRSPIEGFAVRRYKSAGEYVDYEPIVAVAQLHPLRVGAIMPVALFGKVAAGTQATVIVETAAETRHASTVSLVDRVADAASGTFGVHLELPNADYSVPAGVKCMVEFSQAAPATVLAPEATTPKEQGSAAPKSLKPAPQADEIGASMALRSPSAPLQTGQQCAFGPIKDADKAVFALRAAHTVAPTAKIEEHGETHTVGYTVLAGAQADVAATRTLFRQLQVKGLNDIAIISDGGAPRISLGFFQQVKGAEKRIAQLQALRCARAAQAVHPAAAALVGHLRYP